MSELVLDNVIIRYPHLVTPWSSSPQYQEDYNCQLILLQTWPQWAELQAIVEQAITEKWPTNRPENLKLPWLNKYLQPNLQKDGPYQGQYCINAAGKGTKPGVAGPDGKTLSDLQVPQMVFSGCIVNAWVNFGGYPQGGVGTYLKGIQLVNNQVERIADAGRDISEVFKPIAGAPAATAPAPGVPGAPGAPGSIVPW